MDLASIYSTFSYRIRPGTWNESDLDASYEVVKFPVQNDQAIWNLPWYIPSDPGSGVWGEVIEIIEGLDGSRGGFGGMNGSWLFPIMTPDMIVYVRAAIFAGGFSAPVTISTWDRSFGWRVVNCLAHWNDPAKTAEPVGVRGYQKLRIDFVNGIVANPGWSFNNGFSVGFKAEG